MPNPTIPDALQQWADALELSDWRAWLHWLDREPDDEALDGLTGLAVNAPSLALAEINDALPCPCQDRFWFSERKGVDFAYQLQRATALLREQQDRCDSPFHAPDCESRAIQVIEDVAAMRHPDKTIFITVCGCEKYVRWRPEQWSGVLATETHGYCPECFEKLEQELQARERATRAASPSAAQFRADITAAAARAAHNAEVKDEAAEG